MTNDIESRLYSPKEMAVIQDLPVELLSGIFAHLYAMNRKLDPWEVCLVRFKDDEFDKELNTLETKLWSDEDLRNPALFPCATARVSRLWLDVMARNALYWTRVTFDLSAAEPPLLDAFLWSKDLPFDVLVFDSQPSCAGHPERSEAPALELACVSEITDKLTPHLERCQSLVFDVSFASSLPLLPTLLQHSGKNMKALKLEYRTRTPTSIGYDMWLPSATVSPSTKFEMLKHLSLDVETFIRMARRHPRFWEDLNVEEYFTLELSKYDFKDANEIVTSQTYCTGEFFRRISEVTPTYTLILSDLSVQKASQRTPGIVADRILDLNISSFYARNLSQRFLKAFFRECSMHVESATFEGCIFPENTSDVSYCYLTLKGLPRNARPERMLNVFGGVELHVEACPCFDDSIIEYLADTGGEGFACPSPMIHRISLADCDGFTFASIIRLVEVRKACHTLAIQEQDEASLLESLSVRGQSPHLTVDQLQWFKTHMTYINLPHPVP